jgi:hypothetical protein
MCGKKADRICVRNSNMHTAELLPSGTVFLRFTSGRESDRDCSGGRACFFFLLFFLCLGKKQAQLDLWAGSNVHGAVTLAFRYYI